MSSEQSHDEHSRFVANSVLLIRGGDTSQLGLLLEVYRGYLLKIAGDSLSSDLAVKTAPSDVVQETLIKASQSFPAFRGTTELELKEWLKQILINNITDAQRKFVGTEKRDVSREVPLPTDLPEEAQRLVSESQPIKSPLSDLVQAETSTCVQDAVRRLSTADRDIIHLRNYERLEFPEIGRRLNCTEDAARKRWKRAVESLCEDLKQYAPRVIGPV